jgi:hypothetical protein
MTALKTLVSTFTLFVFCSGVHASTTIATEASNDIGSLMLFSAGLVGLFATRKHMKAKA